MSSWLTLQVSDRWCLTFASTIAHSLQYSFMTTSLENLTSYFQGESNPDRADLCWPHEPKQHYHLHNLITNAGVAFINQQSLQRLKCSEHSTDLKFFNYCPTSFFIQDQNHLNIKGLDKYLHLSHEKMYKKEDIFNRQTLMEISREKVLAREWFEPSAFRPL